MNSFVTGILALTFSFSAFNCSSNSKAKQNINDTLDPFTWLYELRSDKSMKWVLEENERSLGRLGKSPVYEQIRQEVRQILVAPDRIPMPKLRGQHVYNFWQDEKHVRGIWRRTTLSDYAKANPTWETVLDIDALAKKENENWVWGGSTCQPKGQRCLLQLSRGGKDAKVVREFDLSKKRFVSDGFFLPEAKSEIAWIDDDTLWVGTDFGPGSLTSSGYPRIVKVWRRGDTLSAAQTVFEGKNEDVSVSGFTSHRPEGSRSYVYRAISFYEYELFEWSSNQALRQINVPRDSRFQGLFQNEIWIKLTSNWKTGNTEFKAGSLIAVPADGSGQAQLVFEPQNRVSIEALAFTRDTAYIHLLDNVKGLAVSLSKNGQQWENQALPLPKDGSISIVTSDDFENTLILEYENHLTPSSLYRFDSASSTPDLIKQAQSKFDSSSLITEQLEARSLDGTLIPYFVMHRQNMKLNGKNPTILYGYGGFEVSLTPGYEATTGKVWLERGGVYVIANIRGGGEFGPAWHQAALLEKRQRAYEDFYAVAEDLINRGYTTAQHLGINGGSNGGLLVGVAFTQRPELFSGVVCEVPLLDMLDYTKLLAGASWIGEYGDPNDSKMRKVISQYSPYQNVFANRSYPEVFFMTSTADDRVHPGHARKMAAKMRAQGHPILFFENVEGGHGAAANLEQRARRIALKFSYFFEKLGLQP